MDFSGILVKTVALGLTAGLIHFLFTYFTSPNKHIPGPFWAKFSNLWRLIDHSKGNQIKTQTALHEKYGSAVRIGPKCISISDPAALKTIFSTRGTFVKSEFYAVNDAVQDGQIYQNMFGTRSNAFHAKCMRPIQKLYSLANILVMEQRIDRTIGSLMSRLESEFIEGSNAGKTCDIGTWISYYAWDVVGEITFSQEIGFLASGSDVNDMIAKAEEPIYYFGVVGQMPFLDKLLGKNPYCPIKFPTFAKAAEYSVGRFLDRISTTDPEKGQVDFLNSFLEAKITHPDVVGDNEVVGYLLINILAGADTTGVAQKAIIYYVLKHPEVLRKLQNELDNTELSFPPPYESVQNLSYLDAVIKEAIRMHPSVGLALERIVPSTGLTLSDGRVIAPGTIVAMNAWVINRSKQVFGDDADEFKPERWLKTDFESAVDFEARIKRMRDNDLTFGAGNRVCIGRHLAVVELYKVTATLFGKYDMELQDPAAPLKFRSWWFTFIDDLHIKIKRRQQAR